MRTPRDNFAINQDDPGAIQVVGNTPKEIKLREQAMKSQLKSQFAALPKPKALDFDLELPEEQQEVDREAELSEEDAAERDRRIKALREAEQRAEFKRRTQVMQRNLPRPTVVDSDALLDASSDITDPAEALIAMETALLIANDALKYTSPGAKSQGSARPLEIFDDDELNKARLEIALELPSWEKEKSLQDFEASWEHLHNTSTALPGLLGHEEDEAEERQIIIEAFDKIQATIVEDAEKGNKLEKRLALVNGGYQQRAKTLRQKTIEASAALEDEQIKEDSLRTLQIAEEAALLRRQEQVQEERAFVNRRAKEAQDLYRLRVEEMDSLRNGNGVVNGDH
jgi:pre-mRNA-splicing factor CDC5/CEF1